MCLADRAPSYTEAIDMLYSQHIFVFGSLQELKMFLDIVPRNRRQNIRSIYLRWRFRDHETHGDEYLYWFARAPCDPVWICL